MHIDTPNFASSNLRQAIQTANEMLSGKRGFFQEVSLIQAFDLSMNPATHRPFSGKEVVAMLAQGVRITVDQYKPWNFWSKAIAYADPGTPVIHLNVRKINRSVPSIVNTLMHESVHIVDRKLNFAHGSNSSTGKDETAPYKIGEIAEKLASV
jgi:hypothetical protein